METTVCGQPEPIWARIFGYLPGAEGRVALMKTCSTLYKWGKADAVWREIFAQRYPFGSRSKDFYQGLVEGKEAIGKLLLSGDTLKTRGCVVGAVQISGGYAALFGDSIALFRRGKWPKPLNRLVDCLPKQPPTAGGIVAACGRNIYTWVGDEDCEVVATDRQNDLALFQGGEVTTAAYRSSPSSFLLRPLGNGQKAKKVVEEPVIVRALGSVSLGGSDSLWVHQWGKALSRLDFYNPLGIEQNFYPSLNLLDYGASWLFTNEERNAAKESSDDVLSVSSTGRGEDLRLVVVRRYRGILKALVFSPGWQGSNPIRTWQFEGGFWLSRQKVGLTEKALLFFNCDGEFSSWSWDSRYRDRLDPLTKLNISDFATFSSGSGVGIVVVWADKQERKARAIFARLFPVKVIRNVDLDLPELEYFNKVTPIQDPKHPLFLFHTSRRLFVFGDDGVEEPPVQPPSPAPSPILPPSHGCPSQLVVVIGVLAGLYLAKVICQRLPDNLLTARHL